MSQFRTPFVVRRKSPGSFVDGDWVAGDYTVFIIQASVQPLKGIEMEMLPEGRRNSQSVRIYTSTKLRTVDEANPDFLQAFGFDFEILSVEPWQSNVISHYKCIGVKAGVQTIPEGARVLPDGSVRVTPEDDFRAFNE